MIFPRRAVVIAALYVLTPPAVRAEDTITVIYSERPPYLISQADGAPTGLTGTPAALAFKTAGIPVAWSNLPVNRQLMMLRDAGGLTCAIGWLWTAERASFAKYTKPIYRDKGWVVLATQDLAARGDTSLQQMMERPETRILIKENYSYGSELDKLLKTTRSTIAFSTAATGKMVQSISKGAVDMMIVTEDEGSYIMAHHPAEQTKTMRLLRFKDLPRGPERHIMCGKAVPDEVIARLNKAITFK